MTATSSRPRGPFCSPAASRWPRWPLGLWRCRLKTPSAGRSPSGTGFPRDSRDSHPNCHPDAGRWALTPPVALHPGAVLGGVAKSATQCTVCPQQAKGLLWLSLSDSAFGPDEGAPPEYRSGHVQPEQELWVGNCALLLSACAEGRAEEAAPGVAGIEGDLSNRFAATPLRSRLPQQTRLLPN